MRLWKELKNRPFCNDFHFLLIPAIIVLIALEHWLFYIVLAIYIFFIIKKTHYLIPVIIIAALTFVLVKVNYIVPNIASAKLYEAKVYDTKDNYYILKINNTKVKAYSYKVEYAPGDLIEVSLDFQTIGEKNYDTDFDYKRYLYSEHIYYQALIKSSSLIKQGFSIKRLKHEYQSYLKAKLSEEAYSYVSAMVFADNNLDEGLKYGYSALGISHILAISGMHIMFLFTILCFVFERVFKIRGKMIPLFILILYVLLLGFPSSAFRALLFILISTLNGNKKDNVYTKLDIFSISCLLMIFISPLKAYQSGFILSYLVSFILLFMNDFITIKNKIIKTFLMTLIIYFLSLPISASFYGKLSITALFTSPLLGGLCGFVLLPICYILSIIPELDFIFKYIFIGLNYGVDFLAKSSILITIPYFNFTKKIIYYLLYSFLLYTIAAKKKRAIGFISFLSALSLFIVERNLIPYTKITFISVGQGDAAIIETPHNSGVIVIDTYNCIDYLRSEGITKIDYLILTHSDNDHIGGAKELINTYNVGKIIYPYFDEECIKYITDTNYEAITSGYSCNICNVKIEALGPINDYKDVNSTSLVVMVTIDNNKVLFAADMTMEEEEDLVNKYSKRLKADILKVGHHGSDTSTSLEFLNLVNPSYSIISVGANNKYGHPSPKTLEKLVSKSNVLTTAENGNISVYFWQGQMRISSYR